ncbi:MAG: hypothetical protein ABFC31_10045 [Clostridiaceae bacterium]
MKPVTILVLDGQGGRIGKQLIDGIRAPAGGGYSRRQRCVEKAFKARCFTAIHDITNV